MKKYKIVEKDNFFYLKKRVRFLFLSWFVYVMEFDYKINEYLVIAFENYCDAYNKLKEYE